MMNPVSWFEIPAKDFNRACDFYKAAFGFEYQFMDVNNHKMAFLPYEMNASGASGAIIYGETGVPSKEGCIVYLFVGDHIESAIEKIKKAGGEITLDVMDIPGGGVYSQFLDTEGNRVGIHALGR